MLVIALALVLLAAACAVVLTEASRSVIPPMGPIVREVTQVGSTIDGAVSNTLNGAVIGTIPTQRMGGEIGSAKADAASRAYVFIAELPAEQSTAVDKTL